MTIAEVSFQHPNMRKPDACVIYPPSGDFIMFHGEQTIGRFSLETGEGLVNFRGSNPKNSIHLSTGLGAVPFEADPVFLAECLAKQPQTGQSISAGVFVGDAHSPTRPQGA